MLFIYNIDERLETVISYPKGSVYFWTSVGIQLNLRTHDNTGQNSPCFQFIEASLFWDLVTVTVTDTHGVQGGVSHWHRSQGLLRPGVLSLEEAEEAEAQDQEAAVHSGHGDCKQVCYCI